ncbi:MAG TPA: uroporphyrinogen-III synthase [Acidimicrobiales bacterium]|nr:uroporphyrinogen-III synthase [Acidimicrobiales bacterium]
MTVYLVGAGPGDPGLLTRRGAEVLAGADVVVHDRRVDASLLGLAPAGAERIEAEEPGDLLVERGRAGREVVRLHFGDPYLFGPGSEEAVALAAAGVPFEVVPGVSPATADPAYGGVPVTGGGPVTVISGRHTADADWASLARTGGTVVVLEGSGAVAERLLAGGLDPSTSVAAVMGGTGPEQRTVRTTLADLPLAAVEPPATLVIRAVAAADLGWYERRPLFGRSVVVTRAAHQASALARRLRLLGARPVELPTIRIDPPADGGAALAEAAGALAAGRYAWVVFTSPNAVPRFCDLIADTRSWAGTRVAAIGPSTASALAAYRLVADLVPDRYVAEGLVAAFPSPAPGGRRQVLLPRAAVARDALPEGLRAAGWQPHVVEAYRTARPDPPAAAVVAAVDADAVCFTSSSTVANYLRITGGRGVPPVVACIGPVTAATAREAGLDVTVVAAEHTVPGLVDALVGALSGAG